MTTLRVVALAALFCFSTACGSFKNHAKTIHQDEVTTQDQPPPDDSPLSEGPAGTTVDARRTLNTHLLFSGIDPLAAPWQASIYQLDLVSHATERLLTGESGDPMLFQSGGEILFFNRYFDSQNFRRLTTSDGTHLTISSQQKFAGGEIGDPHDALYLGDNRVLLAHFTQGKLIVMEQNSGKELDAVEADWDLPSNASLKPEALLPWVQDGRQFVYVVHQALSLKNGLVLANGTQQVFVLEMKEDKLIAVDMNPNVPRIQGIKINGSFPVPVRYEKRDKFLLVSLCSRLVAAMENDPANKCASSVDEIDPSTNTSSQLWDLSASGLFMNGPTVPGPNSNTFYANVDQQTGPESFEKRVVRFDLSDHSTTSVYNFKPESGGFWGSFYDETAKALYVGDYGDGSIGKFVVIRENSEPEDIPLERVPYSGAFLTRTED
jgi:hypothetical protein